MRDFTRMVRLVAILMLPVLVPLVEVVVDRPVIGAPLPFVQQPPSLLWANRNFTSRDDFENFLRSRGARFAVWAERHPNAAPWWRGAQPRDFYAAWSIGSILMLLLLFGIRRPARATGRARPTSRSRAPAAARAGPARAPSTRAAATRPQSETAGRAERAPPVVSKPAAAPGGQRGAAAAPGSDVPSRGRRSAGARLAPVAASRAAIAGAALRVRRRLEYSGITGADIAF